MTLSQAKYIASSVTSDNQLSCEVGGCSSIGGETGVASTVTCCQAEEEDVAGENVVLNLMEYQLIVELTNSSKGDLT